MTQLKRNSITTVSPADMIVNDTKAAGHVNKAVAVKNAMKTYSGAVIKFEGFPKIRNDGNCRIINGKQPQYFFVG